jgi:predicted signal transduction protein with EAL and GGDEF domain
VARLGGDEFVVMLEGLDEDLDSALVIAHRIGNKLLDSLRQPYWLRHFNQEDYPLSITHHSSASIGMTLFQGSYVNCEDLLKQADLAMYQAKHSGRNKLNAFNPELQNHINQRAKLESELRQALKDRQFELYYQVQTDHLGGIMGAEVLLRWHHPEQGCVSPAEFIPLAEETGLINELGLWTLAESFTTLANWAQNDDTRDLTLAVNVSAKQFNQSQFVEQIATLLDGCGFDPQRLKLEITESAVLTDVDETIATMNTLRDLGVSFSMDDFGTGYSSLSYLRQLPLSQLKIDRSFVHDLTTDANDAAIVGTILELGKRFGMEVVAEGVETEAQLRYLVENGCRHFQGYLFGKPEPLTAFERRLTNSKLTGL